MMDCFVGFDTSNYTTSAAVCTLDGEVIANIKEPLPVKAGECGLRQSDAVFSHVKNLPRISEQLQVALSDKRVLAVGCSARPRDAEDSYMPCFLTGVAAANVFASASDAPVFEFSHQNGHVMAAAYSSGMHARLLENPFLAFHVSGGTTEVLYVIPRDATFEVELVAKTEDLNAGQAIDRIGVMMGLSFPCGKQLEALALENHAKVPTPRVCVRGGNCHLSGLENLAEKMYRETGDCSLVAAYTLAFIGETLIEMTRCLDEKYPCLPIVYAGGVMSNRYLQTRLSERKDTYFAHPMFSADNAAGISLLCRKRYLNQNT